MPEITEADFHSYWGARVADSGDLLCFEEIRTCRERQVWTVVDSGDDCDSNWYAVPGVRAVNALGYVTTTKPWSDESLQAIYFLDDALDRGRSALSAKSRL